MTVRAVTGTRQLGVSVNGCCEKSTERRRFGEPVWTHETMREDALLTLDVATV